MVIKAIEKSIDIVHDFLNKIAGPAAEEFGLAFQDKARLYRYKNLIKILEKAKKFAEKSESEIKEIPLRTLMPIIEGASLEDDENLSEKWAALIANAATGNLTRGNHPSYVQILKELSPSDAFLLDEIFKNDQKIIWNDFKAKYVKDNLISPEEVSLSYDNLFRLNLINNTSNGLIKTEFGRYFMQACQKPQ